ncbi:isoleucine--tRNA ligase [Candidatus Saccharibacteria bacterium]|nr:isoleucine--tRNA ligase [Candidatus Saccharibacteria bacterium]
MKYQPRKRAIEYEKELVLWWKKNNIFEKSVEARPVDDSFVFYDGPPFITGMPHHGTLLSSVVKDAVPRYWTMQGKRVERRWGWDCHGLPAENFVEKQLNITDRRQIGAPAGTPGAISLEAYITKARESMVANSEAWRDTIDRVGRFVDFDNAYRTMDKNFMESVWWAFKTLFEAGKIYEGRKVLMYDTKFATPVSKAEVTMDNDAYVEVTDPSAFVKFKCELGYLLAWTTTPWTLPANLALAVNPEMEYGIYEVGGEKLILATELADKVLVDDTLGKDGADGKVEQRLVKKIKGEKLVGISYEPLIETVPKEARKSGTYKVHAADFVSSEDGTGIVHIAPAYGEDDYALSQAEDVDFIDCLDENGYYLPEMAERLHELGIRDTDEDGIEIWAANKFIAKVLEAEGIIYKIQYIKHEYPFNPRSKQRIIYRAFPSWFFDVNSQKTMMLEQNENINWFPSYLKHGRFAKNIEQAPDWNLSRDRFWATAMPVWKGDKGTIKVIGSYDELYDLSGVRLEDYHRPWVDAIEFDIDGEHFKRIDKVLDCWFESGSMPFAQLHYPFENREKFEKNYPADFIVEYVGQVRAWFYYVHTVNTALAETGAFGEKVKNGAKNAFKNVITTGTLAGNDGRKMSKSLGNYTDPNELMDKFSADSLRFLLLSSPVLAGEDFALLDKDVSDVARKLSMIWNVYDFFATYANVDDFEGDGELPELKNCLDIWIVSRIHMLRDEIVEGMEEYNLPKAMGGILPFVDDLSNWFVRRSRRRFWKSEDTDDKTEAYQTLYYVLLTLSKLIAPFVPFLSEELYHNLTGLMGESDSVHLLDYPESGEVNLPVIEQMAKAREVISEGLAQRMMKSETEEQIKVRQPLGLLVYAGDKLPEVYEQMIADEVNVKKVEHGSVTKLDKTITESLRAEGFARELIRVVQAARKKAGLSVDDRIKLYAECELDPEFAELVAAETLATEFSYGKDAQNYAYDEICKVDGEQITISLEKA